MKIRPAHVRDAEAICSLVNYYAERGRMLHRSLESVYLALRDFLVAEEDGRVIGCVAIGIFWADLAELKSLAVAEGCRGKGVGKALVRSAAAHARAMGIRKLFALTYEKDFFARAGFETIARDTLPEKVWRECIYCPKVDECDETAMMRVLPAASASRPRPRQSPKPRAQAPKRRPAARAAR